MLESSRVVQERHPWGPDDLAREAALGFLETRLGTVPSVCLEGAHVPVECHGFRHKVSGTGRLWSDGYECKCPHESRVLSATVCRDETGNRSEQSRPSGRQ